MTISDYYKHYSKTHVFPKQLNSGNEKTIDDFYQNCISQNLCLVKNVLDWHDMFMKYVDMDDAVLWVRYYESGKKINNRHSNRRACYTEFDDGFSYVFVSNFDAHEIYNMVYQGVTPNANEFKDMMRQFTYPLHYDNGQGKSCEESDICAYPHIGNIRSGVLNSKQWYLAHINGIKDPFLRYSGVMKKIDKNEKNRIYPKGLLSDWQIDPSNGKMIRKLNYSLSQDEKDLVKAHFLRFVDPLNYFLVPGESYENHNCAIYSGSGIGEYENLTAYVGCQFENLYGHKIVKDFRDKALIGQPVNVDISQIGNEQINITYGTRLLAPKQPIIKKSKKANKSNKKSITKTTVMSDFHMFAAEDIISSSKDDIELLMTAKSKRRLAEKIIIHLYNNNATFFNRIIKSSVHPHRYDFGAVTCAFAEYSIASTSLNKKKSRYLMSKAYNVNGVDLYLNGDWYTISKTFPKPRPQWPSINDLIRVLNLCFDANFVYIESGKDYQLWGPSGTL